MKRNKGIIFIMICICISFVISKVNSAEQNINLFDEIVGETKSTIEEYGIQTSFEVEFGGEKLCTDIAKKMEVYGPSTETKSIKKPGLYSIEFKKGSMKGYIQSRVEGKKDAVVISISDENRNNGLNTLKERIKKGIEEREEKPKYFQYLKAKLPSTTLEEENKKIINILKKNEASNIETIKINNGYSTVAYTKQYEIMRSNGKWMDFNFALSTYPSGNYLIIGTPIINITY